MVGGPEGSTAGMRFNPRESAEELQDDSSVGREDSEERALHDAKKREKQEKRSRMMQGLQHMKVSVPQKNPEDEEDSQKKQQAELGQMTGQVGQSEAIDGANPRGGGLGNNIMLSDAEFEGVIEVIRKKEGPKYDDEKPQATTDIGTVQARQRAKKGKKKRARKTKTVESLKTKRRRKGKGTPLKAGNVRQPGAMTALNAARSRVQMGTGYTYRQRTAPIVVTTSTGRSRAKQSYPDPRERTAEAERQALRQAQPTQDVTPQIPTMTTQSRGARSPRGRTRQRPHKKAERMPSTAATPMGAEMSEHTSLAGGGASAMAAGGIGSSDALMAKAKMPKITLKVGTGLSARDKIEYRRLIEQLNFLMQRAMRKADSSKDDPPTKQSPNGHPRQTSAPTGPTETDPEDDPTMWGAHAYDLYVRRGGIA